VSVGNDVVDLADPETLREEQHPRFDERVFRSEEKAAIEASDSPHALRWALWAAKEGAYKARKKLEPSVFFSPKEFVVELSVTPAELGEVGKGSVLHRGSALDLEVTWNDEYVHAVASSDRERGARRLSEVALAAREPSAAVRDLAVAAIGSTLGIDPADIEIVGRPPVARHGGHDLPVDLSLSHHGRFVAFAASLLVERRP